MSADVQFVSPARSQPSKKQRAGGTPSSRRSTSSSRGATRTRRSGSSTSAGAAPSGAATRPPPTTTSMTSSNTRSGSAVRSRRSGRAAAVNTGPPPTSSSMFMPPTAGSGAGAGAGPDPSPTASAGSRSAGFSASADDAIARRRAELKRLSDQRTPRSRPDVTAASDLLSSSQKSTTMTAAGPPPTSMSTSSGNAPPVPLPHPVESRQSDLFPNVPKSQSSTASSSLSSSNRPPLFGPPTTTTATTTTTTTTSGAPAPPSSTTAANSAPSGAPPTAPPSGGAPPPPPPVNRRLEFSSKKSGASAAASSSSRAKSAPPARPPPPPPKDQQSGQHPPPTTAATATASSSDQPQQSAQAARRRKAASQYRTRYGRSSSTSRTVQQSPKTSLLQGSDGDSGSGTASGPKDATQRLSSATPRPKPMSAASLLSPAVGPTTSSKSTTAPTTQQQQQQQQPPLEGSSAPAKTPAPTSKKGTSQGGPPSTVRRDKLRELQQGANTPPSLKAARSVLGKDNDVGEGTSDNRNMKTVSETQSRLEQAYKQAQEEKDSALQRIVELEQRLQTAIQQQPSTETQPSSSSDGAVLQQMVQMAEQQGEQAALSWAREQLSGEEGSSNKQVGFLSPMGGMPPGSPLLMRSPETPVRRRIHNRTVTPFPVRHLSTEITDDEDGDEHAETRPRTPVEAERKYIQFFREAANCVPYEYKSDLATFVIRRPYGMETASALFQLCSSTPHPMYARKAHVSDMTTIEIAITISADNSVMLLYGKAGVRVRTNPFGPFKDIPDVDEMDRPLGTVGYIDEFANEKDYSLDEILEEALVTRENYCATITSTALGWKDRPPVETVKEVVVEKRVEVPVPTPVNEGGDNADGRQFFPKESTDMCVGTDGDIPFPPPGDDGTKKKSIKFKDEGEKGQQKEKKKDGSKSSSKVMDQDEATSGDVLAIFLGMVFQSVFNFIWWIFIGLPLSIIKTSLILFVSAIILSSLYIYIIQEHSNMNNLPSFSSSASSSYYTNLPGSGIM